MRILVTGSSGHLGEGLMRVLRADGANVVGLDILPGASTDIVGSIVDRALVRRALEGIDAVLHTATLHKPHVGSHSRQQFIDTNITGTLNLLEESVAANVERFIFTSTTSAFGRALTPKPGEPGRLDHRGRRTRSRATSTAYRRPRPRTSASSSTATTACPS